MPEIIIIPPIIEYADGNSFNKGIANMLANIGSARVDTDINVEE